MAEVETSGRTQERAKTAFQIHNDNPAWPKETSKFCGACVNRVFNRLNSVYLTLKTQNA